MSGTHLSTSTTLQAERLGGVSTTNYMTHSALVQSTITSGDNFLLWFQTSNRFFMSGTGANGFVTFNGTIDVTGAAAGGNLDFTLALATCHCYVGLLNSDSIVEALQSLADIYQWQIKNDAVSVQTLDFRPAIPSTPKSLGKLW